MPDKKLKPIKQKISPLDMIHQNFELIRSNLGSSIPVARDVEQKRYSIIGDPQGMLGSQQEEQPTGRLDEMTQQEMADMNPMNQLTKLVMQHEGLEPLQTPFKITKDSMKNWTSMFDDTIKVELDPNAKKGKDRQNFLYLKRQEDLLPMISEQFRRYAEKPRNYRLPMIPTVADAVRKFDQTGAGNKIKFLEDNGVDTSQPLTNLF